MEQVLAETDSGTLYFSRLLAVFGIMAAILAAIGIYGVTSYAVAERRGEIGIRMALGAQRSAVLRMVLRKALVLTAAGVVVGIAAALGLTRLIGALLFGVEPTDPLTYAAAGLLLGLTALAASYLPARRAAMLDPACTLKYE
jgi:putative ABC transport system permease protein